MHERAAAEARAVRAAPTQHQRKVFPSADANQYVPASVQDVEEHMLRASGAMHPADDGSRMLPSSVRQVVAWIAGFGRGSRAAGESAMSDASLAAAASFRASFA